MAKVLLIDNYDSFTYNLAHLFGALGVDVQVLRNDELDADEAERLAPSHLVVSPGPGRPADAGVSIDVVRRLGPMGKIDADAAAGLRTVAVGAAAVFSHLPALADLRCRRRKRLGGQVRAWIRSIEPPQAASFASSRS